MSSVESLKPMNLASPKWSVRPQGRAADVRGHKILIFQDLSNELSKTQATINSVKTKLHQMAIKFSVHYLAVPPVTHQQVGHKFTKQRMQSIYLINVQCSTSVVLGLRFFFKGQGQCL